MRKIHLGGGHPCMGNWVTLRRNGDTVIARNGLTDEETELTEEMARYLIRLNGDRPKYRIPGFSYDECKTYYSYLDSCFLIREEGRLLNWGYGNFFTVYIPECKRAKTILPGIFNLFLVLSFLPVFVYGLYRVKATGYDLGGDTDYVLNALIGYFGGIFVGIVCHEAAHAFACLSDRNGRIYEAGFMINGIVPGAYVMIDDSRIKSRFKKVQINLAGVEMNLLLSGILLTALSAVGKESVLYNWKIAMCFAAIQNVALCLTNLSFVEGFDGEHTISALLGGSIVDGAKANILYLIDRRKRKEYFNRCGINGFANMCVSVSVLGFQLFVPLMVIAGISVWIGDILK